MSISPCSERRWATSALALTALLALPAAAQEFRPAVAYPSVADVREAFPRHHLLDPPAEGRPVPLLAAAGLLGGALGFMSFSFFPAIACLGGEPSDAWMICDSAMIGGIVGQVLGVPAAVSIANGRLRQGKPAYRKSLLISAALGAAAFGIAKATGDIDSPDFPRVYLILPVLQTAASVYVHRHPPTTAAKRD